MDRSELRNQINEIFVDTLDNENIIITDETKATDIDEWDSLSHILLVVAIEKNFKIKFTSKEIQSWKFVGDMINSVQEKLN